MSTRIKISAQFATSLHSPEHIAAAEQLGYERALLFDTPHEGPDVWMMLALAAQRTTTIGLGPGVLVPNLRHPMVNASATAALTALAPGRVTIAFGTGFAGARALGSVAASWGFLADYVRAFRVLLRGDPVRWQNGLMQMQHPPGHAPLRPIEVPILISALGPKGINAAIEHADGLFTVNGETRYATQFAWAALGVHGTVLADGEPQDSPRVQAAAGPGNALAPRRLRIRRRRHRPARRRCMARHHQPDPAAGTPPRSARPTPGGAQQRRHRRLGCRQLEGHHPDHDDRHRRPDRPSCHRTRGPRHHRNHLPTHRARHHRRTQGISRRSTQRHKSRGVRQFATLIDRDAESRGRCLFRPYCLILLDSSGIGGAQG